jgi:hypothetical protein
MPLRRRRVSCRSRAIQKEIFGPPPILEKEDKRQYALLLRRLYGDLKPSDIIMEEYVHDIAYWTWELRRWRWMRTCLINAAVSAATIWILAVPDWFRLSYIGETDKIDIRQIINPPISDAEKKGVNELVDKIKKEMGVENVSNEDLCPPIDSRLLDDMATTRAVLERSEPIEHFNRMIAIAENRRNACVRELERYRAGLAGRWHEKIRAIDADFTVVKPKKSRGKKNAA